MGLFPFTLTGSYFLFSVLILIYFLNMKPSSKLAPIVWSFGSRSKQCVMKVGCRWDWVHLSFARQYKVSNIYSFSFSEPSFTSQFTPQKRQCDCSKIYIHFVLRMLRQRISNFWTITMSFFVLNGESIMN